MAAIPENEVTQEDMNEWFETVRRMAKDKAREMLLRMKIFKAKFPNPVEGANTVGLADGWAIKATYTINRKLDIASLTTLTPDLQAAGIVLADVVEYKPDLKIAAYRKLTEDQLKLFDQILEIKPGAPKLEIVKPKKPIAP